MGENGKGLDITILCEQIPGHNWMSFASWYSFQKNLPDAKVTIALIRSAPKLDLFQWVYKFKANFVYHSGEIFKGMVVPPTVMAIREYNDNKSIVAAKSKDISTFVDYSDGCGRFVLSTWINSLRSPFRSAMKRFAVEELTSNEMLILKLWERIASLHSI